MKKPLITIMCDYSADGLWYNGSSIDYKYLINEIGLSEEIVRPFIMRLYDWQHTYETFDFFSSNVDLDQIYNTQKFKDWFIEGKLIAIGLRKIIPNKYHVEFYNERDNVRYKVFELVDTTKDNNGII